MKKVNVEGKDICKIYTFTQDMYGDNSTYEVSEVKCLFRYGKSRSEANFAEEIGTDAHTYLDIDNPTTKKIMTSNLKKKSWYFVINRYGEDEWYRIERIIVGRDLLLKNEDNNCHAFLSRTVNQIA